uniref:Malonyl-CoA:ACP transacylase (MAT) domain-containing protein n=1 Tax=Chromera velia CCMP2878 TaxID=1169474 RepID=A0A0G4HAB8_9ALVE|eukprot:Cvel_25499.t1-p1 / transcript=Cvel_25499.t1 / gene=Cvel_25499 / organism=Chromera_velia_CCMP2878 / gene_product=Phenolphthiocerol synthesis polyketide synthase, putative / transcript_product=Phenolphthiocerol synthesis polyketide synthase, putative / location=Cvel_scaffold2898:10150-15368(-) / protein_length=719 / sequence_SO=supercontig / SO=protein_coding / is_pseudo=false
MRHEGDAVPGDFRGGLSAADASLGASQPRLSGRSGSSSRTGSQMAGVNLLRKSLCDIHKNKNEAKARPVGKSFTSHSLGGIVGSILETVDLDRENKQTQKALLDKWECTAPPAFGSESVPEKRVSARLRARKEAAAARRSAKEPPKVVIGQSLVKLQEEFRKNEDTVEIDLSDPRLTSVREVWQGGVGQKEVLVHLQLPESLKDERVAQSLRVYPALLDASFQVAGVLVAQIESSKNSFGRFAPSMEPVRGAEVNAAIQREGREGQKENVCVPLEVWAHVRLLCSTENFSSFDIRMFDLRGSLLVELYSFDLVPLPPSVAIVFAGEDAAHEYAQMLPVMYASNEIFKETVDKCDRLLRGSVPLHDVTEIAMQTIHVRSFVVECGLISVWQSGGVELTAIVGHGVGEFSAAVALDALSLEDALHMVEVRGAAMERMKFGEETAVCLWEWSEIEVNDSLEEIRGTKDLEDVNLFSGVQISGVFRPRLISLSGPKSGVEIAISWFEKEGRLGIKCASHPLQTPMMAPLRGSRGTFSPMIDGLASDFRTPSGEILFVSTSSGGLLHEEVTARTHWEEMLERPVQVLRAVEVCMTEVGVCVFVAPPDWGRLFLASIMQTRAVTKSLVDIFDGSAFKKPVLVEEPTLGGKMLKTRVADDLLKIYKITFSEKLSQPWVVRQKLEQGLRDSYNSGIEQCLPSLEAAIEFRNGVEAYITSKVNGGQQL